MFFLEAFIDDAEELSTKVGFNIRIERRIQYHVMSLFLFLLVLGVGTGLYVSCDHIHAL